MLASQQEKHHLQLSHPHVSTTVSRSSGVACSPWRAWILSATRTAEDAMLSTLDMPRLSLRSPMLALLRTRGRLPKDDACVASMTKKS